jgi:hypothetical protein
MSKLFRNKVPVELGLTVLNLQYRLPNYMHNYKLAFGICQALI